MCVRYQTGFSLCRLGHAPGVGLWALGAQVVIFFQIGHVSYQIDGDDEQNRMQLKYIHPMVELMTLG